MLDAMAAFAGPGTVAAARDGAGASRDQFLKLLVAELTSQDPLDPVDNGDFMQQIVAMQNLEQTSLLTEGLRSFESFTQMASAGALIGRQVSGLSAGGELVAGVVTRVTIENGEVFVAMADGRRLALASVTEIGG